MLKFDLIQNYLSQAQGKLRGNEFCDNTLASKVQGTQGYSFSFKSSFQELIGE